MAQWEHPAAPTQTTNTHNSQRILLQEALIFQAALCLFHDYMTYNESDSIYMTNNESDSI